MTDQTPDADAVPEPVVLDAGGPSAGRASENASTAAASEEVRTQRAARPADKSQMILIVTVLVLVAVAAVLLVGSIATQ
ncbi:MAG: hypothetical protein AB7Q27_28115 [Acidimicrobiia bacterium]